MYGLPGQTLAMARADIEEAARWGTAHLSAYQLTIETNTVFWSKRPVLPEHDACADMQLAIEATLARAGFEHYETSAFAKPGFRCRHNLNYWQFGDYLGIGAGAHGKVSFAECVTRHERIKQPREYLEAALRGESAIENRTVEPRELPFEFMLNAARLADGFPPALFAARTGLPPAALEPGLRAAEERGLIERDPARIRPTRRGRLFLNDLVALFLPERRAQP
jgi:oxygen-independent coproporphyrinogen-3 oxidase